MNAAQGIKSLKNMQRAFQIIACLQINAHMWPKQAVVQDGDVFDFIIMGGGTAGCVVAARLVEDRKTKVLLVEAGGDPPFETNIPGTMIFMDKSDVDWNYASADDLYSSQCQSTRTLDLLLGKMLGGTGSMDFLHFSKGTRQDYDSWAEITDDKSWCYNNLKPYFTKAFDYQLQSNTVITACSCQSSNKTNGKITITKDSSTDYDNIYLNGFEEAGNKIVSSMDDENYVGYAKAVLNIGDGGRQSTAYTYLRPVKDYPNLYVLKNTMTTKILFDDCKNAIGVELAHENGTTITVKARKEVILSAGTINSPKILMLSGIGPAKHLKSKGINVISDLPVGQNFQDHVAVTIILNMTNLAPTGFPRDSRMYPANVYSGCSNINKEKDYPESCSINYVNYAKYLIQFCAVTYGLNENICNAMFGHLNQNQMLYTMVSLQKPKSRGSIQLQSQNYTDAPIVMTGFFSDTRDLEKIVLYMEDFLRVTKTSSLRSAGAQFVDPKLSKCADYKFKSKEYWRCYALCMMTSRRHYAGTNAMGSVVDSRLRVLGVQKLRVVDASVMPTVTKTETFGPTVVIAEKGADMIKTDNAMPTYQ